MVLSLEVMGSATSRRDEATPVGWNTASSPGYGDRPRGDAKRTGSVGAEVPRCSLEDRSCQGMVLTAVSAHGHRFVGVVCVGEPESARGGCPIAWPRRGGSTVEREKSSRRREPSAEMNHHPWAVAGHGPSSKPAAVPAIAPGPFRGWGRKPLARIRAQREPVVSPAGAGTEYRRPRGVSWRLARQGARRLFGVNGRTADQGNRVGRHSRTNRLLALRPHVIPGRTVGIRLDRCCTGSEQCRRQHAHRDSIRRHSCLRWWDPVARRNRALAFSSARHGHLTEVSPHATPT